jgi:hypothetical protein
LNYERRTTLLILNSGMPGMPGMPVWNAIEYDARIEGLHHNSKSAAVH